MSRANSVSSQEVKLKLPSESIRKLKGLDKYQERGADVGPLGNQERWKQVLARECIQRIAQDFGIDGDFAVTGDGSIVSKED